MLAGCAGTKTVSTPPVPPVTTGPRVEITSYGRYTAAVRGQSSASGVSGGVTLRPSPPKLIEQTTTIPARVGEVWGFTMNFINLPEEGWRYRMEMHHPPIRQPDGKVLTESVQDVNVPPGARI
ncbi:unnamed protein product, partial [marine sediment metagenome]